MCSLALGMIMAGSCDVESFKILRVLRKRFESEMNFGHNQAISQAMGMVFLG
jgi:Proteasome/cyclosome repeat